MPFGKELTLGIGLFECILFRPPLEPGVTVTSKPMRIAITGSAGQIGYSLLFRIASGQLLGPDQPVILQLLEIPSAMKALEGVAMEIDDCAFPLVDEVILSDRPEKAFDRAELAVLVGSRPRTKGMERKDLLEANGAIFTVQGRALNDNADEDLRVLVVGNPANTNALIAMKNAPDIPSWRFTAMTRLDHNRALTQVAQKCNAVVSDIRRMTIWGNHSATQYPDLFRCEIDGQPVATLPRDGDWLTSDFIPTVQQRGAAIIEARGASSAASAASAAIDHLHVWLKGTAKDDWGSMAVPSDGSYGVSKGLISSFPVTCSDGAWEIVGGLDIDDFSRKRINITVAELEEERETVRELGLI